MPIPWVTDNTPGTNHIQININQTLDQMRSRLNGSGMVSVFPESTFSFLAPVKFPWWCRFARAIFAKEFVRCRLDLTGTDRLDVPF